MTFLPLFPPPFHLPKSPLLHMFFPPAPLSFLVKISNQTSFLLLAFKTASCCLPGTKTYTSQVWWLCFCFFLPVKLDTHAFPVLLSFGLGKYSVLVRVICSVFIRDGIFKRYKNWVTQLCTKVWKWPEFYAFCRLFCPHSWHSYCLFLLLNRPCVGSDGWCELSETETEGLQLKFGSRSEQQSGQIRSW